MQIEKFKEHLVICIITTEWSTVAILTIVESVNLLPYVVNVVVMVMGKT